jgi:hypothetical protein
MKILIVLSRSEYVRNYGQTAAFRRLCAEHDCSLVLSDRCSPAELRGDAPAIVGTFATTRKLDRAHLELFNVLTWQQRRKSRTFRYRFSRLYRDYPNTSPRNVLHNLAGLRKALKYVLLGNRWLSRVSVPRLIARLPINPELARFVDQQKPDLVLFPCSAYDPVGNDLARLGAARGFRTLFLVDNWDNLSSKSIFWAKPDYLGVWGEQSRQHATEIHAIAPERVFAIGTPRFEGYYALRQAPAPAPYPFPYLLFCGSALAFDELAALHLLDRELSQHPAIYGELRIVYRPHPERQPRSCPDRFDERDFSRVILDEQVEDRYYRGDASFPSLDYYPGLLSGAKLVVGPLTTMLIEAILCGTPVLAIAYDDRIHFTSPHNARKFYLHFDGIEDICGLSVNRERSQLAADLRARMSQSGRLEPAEVDASLEHFLHHDPRPYPERLAAVVRALDPGGDTDAFGGPASAGRALTR